MSSMRQLYTIGVLGLRVGGELLVDDEWWTVRKRPFLPTPKQVREKTIKLCFLG
jgi:hypothetical protein